MSYSRVQSLIFIFIVISIVGPVHGAWNATAVVRNLWATPVMEYSGLFSEEQLQAFSADVKRSWSDFLVERNNPQTRRRAKPLAFGTSTPNDKDRINEEFFNYQSRNPIQYHTLETVWQAFVFACQQFVKGADLPPIEYQRETKEGGSLEWTTDPNPKRGPGFCWGSVQFAGTHHDIHTHPGSALAGTIYLEVPSDGGALSLNDPRGLLPPFSFAYRILPEAGKFAIFPGTLPHSVHTTPGDQPRVSISCNYPGDWRKFTTSKVVYGEKTFTQEMRSREEIMEMQQKSKE